MTLEDKIYFIDDILDEYEKRGGDRKLQKPYIGRQGMNS